jgi:type IV pilus assembly protein PilO
MNLRFDPSRYTNLIERYRYPSIILANLLIFGLIFFFAILPQQETKKKLELQHSDLQKEYTALLNIQMGMEQFRRDFEKSKGDLQRALAELPERKDIPGILRTISTIGGETRVKIRFFEPKNIINKDFYAELPFEMKYSGGYANVGQFFDDIRRMQRIVHLPIFFLEAKGPPTKVYLEGTCTARTFLFTKEQPQVTKGSKEARGGTAPKK